MVGGMNHGGPCRLRIQGGRCENGDDVVVVCRCWGGWEVLGLRGDAMMGPRPH